MRATGSTGVLMEQQKKQSNRPSDVASDGELIGGVFKKRPSDFIVEELPLYEAKGEGEHLYLQVEKTNLSHEAMVAALMRQFNVPRQAIGTAGRKDKKAITRQWVSVHLHKDPSTLEPHHECIAFLEATRHANKLRLGHLRGNRFFIRIREIELKDLSQVRDLLASMVASGLPNYFDQQRFGVRGINHLLGRSLIAKDSTQLVRLLTESEDIEQWPIHSPERLAANWLEQGKSAGQIAARLGRQTRQFWISALQSAVFNRVLERRVRENSLVSLSEGDLAWKHDGGSVFAVTGETLQDLQIAKRLADFEISPSGPMWGSRMTRCGKLIDEIERECLQEFSLVPEQFSKLGRSTSGARRPLRVAVGQATADASEDEHGKFIELSFELPPGSYATVVLRAITGALRRNNEEDLRIDQP